MRAERARILAFLLVAGLVMLLCTACGCSENKTTSKETDSATTPRENAAPPSTIPSAQGGASASEAAIAQAEAEGKPALLKFGSGKCVPCMQIEENINKIRPEYDGKAVFVIAVLMPCATSIDSIAASNVSLPVALQPPSILLKALPTSKWLILRKSR